MKSINSIIYEHNCVWYERIDSWHHLFSKQLLRHGLIDKTRFTIMAQMARHNAVGRRLFTPAIAIGGGCRIRYYPFGKTKPEQQW